MLVSGKVIFNQIIYRQQCLVLFSPWCFLFRKAAAVSPSQAVIGAMNSMGVNVESAEAGGPIVPIHLVDFYGLSPAKTNIAWLEHPHVQIRKYIFQAPKKGPIFIRYF